MSKDVLKISASVLIVICAVLLAVFAAGWLAGNSMKWDLPELTAELSPSQGAVQGGDVLVSLPVKLPWGRRISSVKTELPAGIVPAGKPGIEFSSWHYAYRTLILKQTVRPLRSGKSKPGRLLFEIRQSGKAPLNASAVIPSFEAAPSRAEKLQLASAVEIRKQRFLPIIIAAAVLVSGGIFLAWYLRRPRKPRELTEWELAVNELAGLKRRIEARELAPEQAFISLTELMRRYLERRFDLPVTRRTAQEFLNIMETFGHYFPEGSRPFLRDFLAEADLVKFAKAVPEEKMVERSAESAEQFISRTRPESEVKNV